MRPEEISLEYLAGFFDGEGSISIGLNSPKNTPRSKNPNHTLHVGAGNTNPMIIKYLYDKYGGSFFTRDAKGNQRKVWQWGISSRRAEKFLQELQPFLRMKQPQANLALAFMEHKIGKKGPTQVSAAEIEIREKYRHELITLNGRALRQKAQNGTQIQPMV